MSAAAVALKHPRLRSHPTEIIREGAPVPKESWFGSFAIVHLQGLDEEAVRVLADASQISCEAGVGIPHSMAILFAVRNRGARILNDDAMASARKEWKSKPRLHPAEARGDGSVLAEIIEQARWIASCEGRELAGPLDLLLGMMQCDNGCRRWLTTTGWATSAAMSAVPGYWLAHFARTFRPSFPALAARVDAEAVPFLTGSDPSPPPAPPSSGGHAPAEPPVTLSDVADGKLKPVAVWDPDAVWEALNWEFPWMEEANLLAAQGAAAVRAGLALRLPPIVLHGPAGAGKSRWARRLAALGGSGMSSLALGGGVSGAAVSGFEKTWKNSAASLPARAMRDARASDPVIFLDEIDKASSSGGGGSVHEALLNMLEKDSSAVYPDVYLGRTVDASRITWIMAANSLAPLPQPLLDRVEAVKVPRPTEAQAWPVMLEARRALHLEGDTPEVIERDAMEMRRAFLEGGSLRRAFSRMDGMVRNRLWSPPRRVVSIELVPKAVSRTGGSLRVVETAAAPGADAAPSLQAD